MNPLHYRNKFRQPDPPLALTVHRLECCSQLGLRQLLGHALAEVLVVLEVEEASVFPVVHLEELLVVCLRLLAGVGLAHELQQVVEGNSLSRLGSAEVGVDLGESGLVEGDRSIDKKLIQLLF